MSCISIKSRQADDKLINEQAIKVNDIICGLIIGDIPFVCVQVRTDGGSVEISDIVKYLGEREISNAHIIAHCQTHRIGCIGLNLVG